MKEKLERRSNVRVAVTDAEMCFAWVWGRGEDCHVREPMSLRPITKVLHHRNGRDVIFQVATIGVHLVRLRRRVSLAKGCVKNARMSNPSPACSEPVGQTKDDTILQGCHFDNRQRPGLVDPFVQFGVTEVELERE